MMQKPHTKYCEELEKQEKLLAGKMRWTRIFIIVSIAATAIRC